MHREIYFRLHFLKTRGKLNINRSCPVTLLRTSAAVNPSKTGEQTAFLIKRKDHHATFTFPDNKWRGEITPEWFQGNLKPESPHQAIDINMIGHGVMFRGTKGTLIADFVNRILVLAGTGADMTYYSAPSKLQVLRPDNCTKMGNLQGWIRNFGMAQRSWISETG
jgi:hypothetical protein